MKKSLMAVALLAGFAGVAQAQTAVQIYGTIDAGMVKRTDQTLAIGKRASNTLGFKGTEDLGDGLKANFLIEHGWGGREVTPDWQPVELKSVASFWGHQGLFESLGEAPPTPDAPPPPPMSAPEPNHAPLQVIDGNYERMSGVCPWWDAVKRGGRA